MTYLLSKRPSVFSIRSCAVGGAVLTGVTTAHAVRRAELYTEAAHSYGLSM